MPQSCLIPAVPEGFARSRLWRVAVLIGLTLSLGCVTRGQAATTWTVCASGCNYTSIKAAIAAPTTVDGDTLAIAAGTYTEAGITVNKSLTLQGEGAATTIVQGAASRGTAPQGVFVIHPGVTVTIQALTIRYGTAWHEEGPYQGGGVENAGTLTLINTAVRDNDAYNGGGLANLSNGILTVINSTISGNAAAGGGGITNVNVITLINSTVSGNTTPGYAADNRGGGLYNWGTLTLTHSTVSGNAAGDIGGLGNQGSLILTHSIVAGNPRGGDCGHVLSAQVTSRGYNLDGDGSCRLTASTDLPGVDPLLAPLQKNGGPTLTHALLPGSPAIDAIPWGTDGCGTTGYSDQRWQARPQPAGGACDIGAYEVKVAGQAVGGWVTGLTPRTAVCQNVTTGQEVTLSAPASPWDCEAAGLGVTAGDQVALRVRGPVEASAADVGGAVVGMTPKGGRCTNLTTGQQVPFRALFQGIRGATAASCVAAGLIVHPGETVQLRVQGTAE
jgi:hypothetical protein